MAQQDVQVILASTDLESPHFDPIEFINILLPTEQSLADIDIVIGKVQASMQKADEDLRKDVRYCSTQRTKATNAFKASQFSIQELCGKIHEIKAKAQASENMVQEICSDIKTLDSTKLNITKSIKTLRRLQMLVSAMDQLRGRALSRHYREVGNLLEAINQLLPTFVEFKTIPKIHELLAEISELKQTSERQSKEEFQKYDEQLESNVTSGAVNPNVLRDVCFVISALGTTVETNFIGWFVETQIKDYRDSFAENAEVSQLEHIEKRYAWLMREFIYLDEVYAKVFPGEWKMPIKVAIEFCICTRLDIAAFLEARKDNMHVPTLYTALKKTVDFEKELCTKLQEILKPKKEEKPKEEELLETGYIDEEQADGFGVKFSAEAIKKKWENHLLQKEKAKQAQAAKKPIPISEEIFNQFRGMISTCFDPYMDHYIREEDKSLHSLLEKLIAEETWITPVSVNNKVLLSSTDLIYYFNEARKKIAPLTNGQPLYDLFLLFKKYLSLYASALHNKIEEHPINSTPKALSETDELATTMIINTAEYCASTTAQITQTLSKLVDEKFKEKIDLASEADAFSGVTSRGLKALATHIEGKIEPAVHAMAKIKWGEVSQVGEQSDYVSQIEAELKATLPRLKFALSTAHFHYVCDVFVTSFISRGIIQNLYKCKLISNDGAHQLLLDIATVKDTLLHVVGQPPPTRFTKLVNKEIGRVEAILKLLTMPNDAIVRGYFTMIPDGSDADLHRILALKGMKKEDRTQLLQRYLNPTPHPLSSSTPSITIATPPTPHRTSSPLPLPRTSPSSAPSSRPDSPRTVSPSPNPTPPISPIIPSFFSSTPFSSTPSSTSVVMPAALKASLKNFLPDLFEHKK